ncbi:MAG: AarF/ABC1/UbiB kinase family protein [Pseudomonadota bacterium]
MSRVEDMSNRTSASRPIAVPSSRMSRLARLGTMATGIAGGMAIDGAKQWSQGRRPAMRELLLTPSNMSRLADQLARMRGAAMKVGQLLSMDTGDFLPPELADILARLRANADYMPPKQLKSVLTAEWGSDWLKQFKSFDPRPIAAASIGQVHRAKTRDGRDLAIKIQYPGVRRSIDSDVDNVAALIRVSGLIPEGMDVSPLLVEAKRQLHEEADYKREGGQLARFSELLADAPEFQVPELQPDLTTNSILAMTFVEGIAIEDTVALSQTERDRITHLLINLLFRELFEFRLMQTDPNFANFRYNPETGRVVLLDFGASRPFGVDVAEKYDLLLRAGMSGNLDEVKSAGLRVGFYDEATAAHHQQAVAEMMDLAFEALRHEGAYDFTDGILAARLREAGRTLGEDRTFVHLPPMDVLYLQRKFAGIYLLASRLGARVHVRDIVERHLTA